MVLILLATAACGPSHQEVRIRTTSDAILSAASGFDGAAEGGSYRAPGPAADFLEEDLAPRGLTRYSDGTLSRLFEALDAAALLQPDNARALARVRAVFEEKVRRGTGNEFDVRRLVKAYLSARDLDSATAIAKRFPAYKLPVVPRLAASSRPAAPAERWRVYEVLDGGQAIRPAALPLDSGQGILMVMYTSCSAAQTALEAILADPEIAPVFRARGYVVSDAFDSVGVAKWRERFKFPNIFLTMSRRDFPGIGFRIFPGLYFLRDGKIVSRSDGWNENALESFREHASRP